MWNWVEQTAREVFGTFGFGEIRLPIFEPTELFARAVGGETDIVSKEMYSFEDHEYTDLDRLRSTLLLWELDQSWLTDVASFTSQLETFKTRFAEAYAAGLVPRVPKNQSALTWISEELTYIEEKLAELQPLENYRGSAKEMFISQERLKERLKDFKLAEHISVVNHGLQQISFGDHLSLRPEATASVCRAYIEHGMQALAQPVKLYCMGPMFRRERPQKGRYRQFYQIDVEVLEAVAPNQDATKSLVKDAAVDAEVIEMVMTLFGRMGLDGVVLEINSIGHSAAPTDGKALCRRAYVESLKAALENVKDKLGVDSQRRIETNPLRVLDSKLESEQEIIAGLPRIGDHLCADCAKHYAEVKRQLELRGVAYRENWRLVRGLDYYMRTTFEITARGLGSQNAVCGGGRYDGLVELLGGPPTKGIGFAIGEDRVILSLLEAGKGSAAQGRDVYIAWMGEKTLATAIRAARDLRQAGFRVELPPVEQKFGKALGQADKLGARYALILGEDEVASGEWTVKTLADGTQGKVREEALVEFLRKTRKLSS